MSFEKLLAKINKGKPPFEYRSTEQEFVTALPAMIQGVKSIACRRRGFDTIAMHYGIGGARKLTLAQIGEKFDVTPTIIGRTEKEVIAAIRRFLTP